MEKFSVADTGRASTYFAYTVNDGTAIATFSIGLIVYL
ncbi:putative membrane protein [Proteus mirabilis]|nr:putative membrane protein [Proteus mirabilis]PVF84053.1 putative membrane protein [Proteus mirabilis]